MATTARDLAMLTKPRLSTQVLITAFGGLWLAGKPFTFRDFLVLFAIHSVVAAANAFNCYLERESDKLMSRTQDRPLPGGRMEAQTALQFAFLLAGLALPTLLFAANALTAGLGLLALVLYVCVYTPLKRKTHWAMEVGAIPGALPPLMGWTAATGKIGAPGVALFLILLFWQLPHFIAIALFRKPEYRKAGLTTLPLERGDAIARGVALAYSVALVAVSFGPWLTGSAALGYAVAAAVLGAGFLGLAVTGWWQNAGPKWARQFFFASLIYLIGLFVALGLARVV